MASTPSGASSRLLTMKFMQRAAAAAAAPPSSPGPSQSEDERPSKRVKTAPGSSPRMSPARTPLFDDQKAAQAALEAEEQRSVALIERQAEKLGDAHWKLDPTKLPAFDRRKGVPLNIVRVGFSQIDREQPSGMRREDTHDADEPNLQSYRPNETKTPTNDNDISDSDSDADSDSDSDSEDASDSGSGSDDSPAHAPALDAVHDPPGPSRGVPNEEETGTTTPGRAIYGTKRQELISRRQSAEREKAKQLAEKRRKRAVDLNNLTSISGALPSKPNNKDSKKSSQNGRRR